MRLHDLSLSKQMKGKPLFLVLSSVAAYLPTLSGGEIAKGEVTKAWTEQSDLASAGEIIRNVGL